MQIGIMDGTIVRPTLSETLDAIVNYGIYCMQFGLGRVGLPELPEQIDAELCDQIRKEFDTRNVNMAAISGTFNMIHPDSQQRTDGLRRLRVLASACEKVGTSVITLCTGTRDSKSMWRRHPDNDSPEAWNDLVGTMHQALQIAKEYKITLAFEPEVANVVDSAQKARRLLDEMGSPYLKVVIDGANIFHAGELPRMREILDEAFVLLDEDIIIAHAKDLDHDGEAGHLAAGKGLLDYRHYLSLLDNLEFDVPLILHGLSETQVPECIDFLREKM
ncbi:TPA: sugar phosphate isomerase/epimerase [Candidatus Poribacteria bacterium]|nr:sugar phosphate isomerase/epimerase [Candidatus Poribacteria bacterium]HIB88654.1 sugar phosphate isomerase/epimerase [Candidatus Poribacteria bacterium]HIB98358.1 sugar phosphate isomerase/epimerase [Candidatus Poribacteria bacterium]